MDIQIKHVVAVKVIGMAWCRGQVTQLQNMALKSYPQIYLRCSSSNAHNKSEHFPQRARKILPLRSHAYAPNLFSAFKVRTPFGCELSSSGMAMNVSFSGLMSGLCTSYYGSFRTFSQIPKVGTRSRIIQIEDSVGGKTAIKTFNKHPKWPKTFVAQKGNSTTTAEGKPLEDANVSCFNGQVIKDEEKTLVTKSIETNKGKQNGNTKKQSESKKKQNDIAPTTSAELANGSGKESQVKKSRNNKSKPSSVSSEETFVINIGEINSTSSTPKEVVDRNSSTKKATKKAMKGSTKKGKTNTSANSAPKSNKELTVQSGSRGRKGWPQLYPPITKSVLVVESVTKAEVIQRYLGDMYEVLPSYGHVRDLAASSRSVRPDDDFCMIWEVPSAAWSHLKSIKVALSGAENLILASDPDREGEAIAWHIIEMLHQQDALRDDVAVARVVFNEITESSIKTALQNPREIDTDLVHAYLARRALDYLIGFNISPLIWRKLPGCQSAGRVQSAALALICDREKEIDEFKAHECWTIDARFQKKDSSSNQTASLSSHLTHFDSNKLNQLTMNNEMAKSIEEKINVSNFEVIASKTSKLRRNPPTPYTTSTLQQDAANKLNFSASHTMKIAQKLYEGVQLSDGRSTGLITYMRTDGLHLSDEAANHIQSLVVEKYGSDFAAKTLRKYFKKVKNAQEAHEAIRPTDIRRLPSTLVRILDDDSLKLYTLIWSRTMACQMEPAINEQIQCDIGNGNQSIMFRSSCSRIEFLGFKAVYGDTETIGMKNGDDDESDHRSEVFEILNSLKIGQPLCLTKVELDQHHTLPPPRYSEGGLVKKLEELGIGRPSTYATTIKVLKDRNYVTTKGRTLFPEFRGRMVSAFLSHYFSEVTDYSFTADMETELDNVSAGMTEWKGLLKDYWTRFSKYCESASNVDIRHVEKMLEKAFGDFLFSNLLDGNKSCPSCLDGTLVFKVSQFGAVYFIGCDRHPKCKYIAKTLYGEDEDEETPEHQRNVQEPKLLGLNPGSNEKVLLKCGPFGHYVQLDEDRKGHLPKRATVPRMKNADSITLEDALDLLQYPVTLGNHPDDNKPVLLKLTRVGFSIKHRRTTASVPKKMKPSDITLEKALTLLRSKDVRRSGRPKRNAVAEVAT